MSVTIKFDNLKELQAFLKGKNVTLSSGTAKKTTAKKAVAKKKVTTKKTTAKKAVAKKKITAKKTTAKKVVAKKKITAKKTTAKKVVAKRKVTAKKTTAKKVVAKKKVTVKKTTAKKVVAKKKVSGPKLPSLTGKIQTTIQSFITKKQAFTANDIFTALSKRDKTVKKQSVITSVLKQMKTTFATVKVTEQPGAGPRPVKVYKPA